MFNGLCVANVEACQPLPEMPLLAASRPAILVGNKRSSLSIKAP